MKRIAVFVSGRGSNFEAIADSIALGRLEAEIALVLSNNPDAKALAAARQRGLASLCLPSKGVDSESWAAQAVETLAPLGIDLICLAGFMRRVGAPLLEAYPQRILNIHPSLLPSFPGLDVQQQALDYGVRYSGCTVHFVDAGVDTGPIIEQAAVPVLDDDTAESLAARILVEEHRIYSQAIALVLSGEYRIAGRRVVRVEPRMAMLRFLTGVWQGEGFVLEFSAAREGLMFGAMVQAGSAAPYWETFRFEEQGDDVWLMPAPRGVPQGRYRLVEVSEGEGIEVVFEDPGQEKERRLIFSSAQPGEVLVAGVEGVKDGQPYTPSYAMRRQR